ncbi:MAG: protein BatD [Bdellovibrionales bacterium]|jgi:hypothetical protein|nr:protein BatD [Bdellovibrionales bacterium]MBT3524782.1 protein BatD [Bdellovibrionales bacterium]MBT7767716.1 protein BatD [Bdellovibrionales bacterium]
MKIIVTIITLIYFTSLWGAAPKVNLLLERNQATVGDELTLTVEIENLAGRAELAIENGDHFKVKPGGGPNQMTYSYNGQVTKKTSYLFYLYPKKIGIFNLGPIVATIQGSEYRSNQVKLSISKAPKVDSKNRKYFIEANLDQKTVYLNQQVIFTFRYHTRVRIVDAKLNLPDFDGFWKEELGKQRNYQRVENGVKWSVVEVRLALFPLKSGVISVPATTLQGSMIVQDPNARRARGSIFSNIFDDDFFGGMRGKRKTIRMSSKPLTIKVKPLPPPVPSKGEFGQGVGHFSSEWSVDKLKVKKGDSVTLTIKTEGVGNILDIKIPFHATADFKSYRDKPQVTKGIRDGFLGGQRIDKIALVPLKSGRLPIPPLKYSYFNLKAGEYQTIELPPIYLTVDPIAGGKSDQQAMNFTKAFNRDRNTDSDTSTNKPKQIKLLGRDLMQTAGGFGPLQSDLQWPQLKIILYCLILLSPLMIILSYLHSRHRSRLALDSSIQRRSKAYRSFKQRVAQAKQQNSLSMLSESFRRYLSDKLNLDGVSISAVDVHRIFNDITISGEFMEQIKTILQQLEMAQFGGNQAADQLAQLSAQLEQLAKRFEREIR